MKPWVQFACCAGLAALATLPAAARIKLAALPERGATTIRLDNPAFTLIEEERVLTLQKGVNKVDFSWAGVAIDPDSIRLAPLANPDKVLLLNVSFPPGEAALVWEISCPEAIEEPVRISYLLSGIDRLITYRAVASKDEKTADLKSHAVLRNFSGEDFEKAAVILEFGGPFEQSSAHEETRQTLFLSVPKTPIEKVWRFDSAKQVWDPEKVDGNVGIPVYYRILNDAKSGLGNNAMAGGKIRVFQEDGRESTIFSGEDVPKVVPVGEKMEVYVGDSRDIVVTQRKMQERQINIRKNTSGNIILFDTDEVITAKIENFKDTPAVLTMIQHIPGQWEMKDCNLEFKKKDAETLEFEIPIPAQGKQELNMHFQRRNVRPGRDAAPLREP